MRILITNDDGVHAPGLAVAERIAREVAGPDGEIWTVAPEIERSGVSHAITYNGPIRLLELAERRWIVSGTPADCAIAAFHQIMPAPPDLVLSGVNRGHNVGEDAVYSGTVGGAMEGALQGAKAISLSQHYTRAQGPGADIWRAARALGAEAVRKVLALPWSPDTFYNVNFPPCSAEDVKGFTLAPQGRRAQGAFACLAQEAPGGKLFHWLAHMTANTTAEPGSDCALGVDGWVTITPMRPNLTDTALMDRARDVFGGAKG